MGELIAIVSGKGGTGKTTVCAGLSTALAESGKRVLCIDCDAGLRNLDISLGFTDSGAISFVDVLSGSCEIGRAPQHPRYPTLHFLTAPINICAEQVDGVAFSDMLRDARREFDYVFLDAPAGVDAGFRLAVQNADRILLVTASGPAAVRDAARVSDILTLMGKRDVRLIVNRINRDIFSTLRLTVDDIMDTAGLPLCGIVPDDENVILAASYGEPLLAFKRRSPAGAALRSIAKRIQGVPVPITLR